MGAFGFKTEVKYEVDREKREEEEGSDEGDGGKVDGGVKEW